MNLLRKILLVTIIAEYTGSTEAAELKCTFNCQENNPLSFENSVTGSSETTELKCICNCQLNKSLPFGDSKIEATKHSKFAPIMEQIKQITGIMPTDEPPSEEVALERIAEILDVPIELLVIEDGKAYLVDVTRAEVSPRNTIRIYPASSRGLIWNSYVLELKKFISVKRDLKQSILRRAYNNVGDRREEYVFDTSDEAKERRRNLAQRPWPNEFTHVLEQIERITGVKLDTFPPNKNIALKRVADIFEIPVELLTFKEGRVHVIDTKSIKVEPSAINAQLKTLYDGDPYYRMQITNAISSLTGRYKDQLQRYLPVYSGYISPEQIKAASIWVTSNVCNKWEPKAKKFSPNVGVYLFDISPEAQQRRKEIVKKPWNE